MMDLPETVIDEIFERALRLQQRVNSPDYIKFLLRYKKVTSAFELLVHSRACPTLCLVEYLLLLQEFVDLPSEHVLQ